MALSPISTPDDRAVIITDGPVETSRTYSFDMDSGVIGGIIDGEDALRQFVRKAISTARFRFLIYNDDYGCELEDIGGQDMPDELLQAEVPRMITEALIGDERISDVNTFLIGRSGDTLTVSFFVETVDGALDMEVTI